MFVPFDPAVRVHLGVVALGTPARLAGCLEALRSHAARHDFVVSVCVNADSLADTPAVEAPDGVQVVRPAGNLGWGGGLHLLRPLADADLFVWVQDDVLPEPGWLDALVDAADAHPRVGVFGALRVDDEGRVLLHNGGLARPPGSVARWNDTDTTADDPPAEVTRLEWVTSKGCLVRTEVFDAVGGPDPRLWPLNHVDKDLSTHVRAHGWDVALVPQARVRHGQSLSAPSVFREFLTSWRDPWFDARWGAVAAELAGRGSAVVEHPCAEWRDAEDAAGVLEDVEAASGRAATTMLVPFARHAAAAAARREAELLARLADRDALLAEKDAVVADLEQRRRRLRRRLARLRRRVASLERMTR